MERKLASIQTILDLQPIPGADAIEVATVLGWRVCVKKGEFHVGDRCIYIEVDSVLPEDNPEFAFLAQRKFRINTIRLRGQISQGICFPLSILETLPTGHAHELPAVEIGNDVTQWLGITKYEPPLPKQLMGEAKGARPWFVPKTDEMRIQAVPGILERWPGTQFFVTEKIDGTSMSAYIFEGTFGVCSRNLDLLESGESYFWEAARALQLEERLKSVFPNQNLVLQGELAGEKIQGNKLKLRKQNFFLFNVFFPNGGHFASFDDMQGIAQELKLSTVPVVETTVTLSHSVDELVAFATRKSTLNGQTWAEGIVLRPLTELQDPEVGRLSFKVINPEFLLKHNE